jgi:mannose-1-phosphate guanylyltransferase
MKAIILVGGEGTRLRPLTFDVPKQMLEVAGISMLERVVNRLAYFGVTEVVLSLGYRPDVFLNSYPDGYIGSVKLSYAVEPEPLDTAGAIRFAARESGIDETMIVVNGDVLSDIPVDHLLELHRDRGGLATIALVPVEDPSAFGVVPTNEDGRVTAFIEKPPSGTAPTNFINAGTYVIDPAVLEMIASNRRVSIEKEIFPKLVGRGQLFAKGYGCYWIDAGTPKTFLDASLDIVAGKFTSPLPVGFESDEQGNWSCPHSLVEGEVLPYSYIGHEAHVAAGSVIEASIVSDRVVVMKGARVERSVILPGARIDSEAVVVNSIIGRDAVIPIGAAILEGSVISHLASIAKGSTIKGERVPM